MDHRTRGVLVAGGLAVAIVVVLTAALELNLDRRHCKVSFAASTECIWTSTAVTTGIPEQGWRAAQSGSVPHSISLARSHRTLQPGYADATLWAVTNLCPEDYIVKRQACAVASGAAPVQSATDDVQLDLSDSTDLPLPKRWLLATTRNSPLIKSLHVEMPLDLATVLGFYRAELSKRGWTENEGAVVAPDRAVIAFTTTNGPALLRLVRASADSAWVKSDQDDRTIADISLRKPVAAEMSDILPRPGQVKLMFGNETDEAAVITINDQTIKLAARAARHLMDAGRKLADTPEIDLPPGRYKMSFAVASGAAHTREFEVAADETWGLMVGPAGVPLPVHLY
jgi:hypothetical protein